MPQQPRQHYGVLPPKLYQKRGPPQRPPHHVVVHFDVFRPCICRHATSRTSSAATRSSRPKGRTWRRPASTRAPTRMQRAWARSDTSGRALTIPSSAQTWRGCSRTSTTSRRISSSTRCKCAPALRSLFHSRAPHCVHNCSPRRAVPRGHMCGPIPRPTPRPAQDWPGRRPWPAAAPLRAPAFAVLAVNALQVQQKLALILRALDDTPMPGPAPNGMGAPPSLSPPVPSALEPTAAVDPSGLGPKELRAATDEASAPPPNGLPHPCRPPQGFAGAQCQWRRGCSPCLRLLPSQRSRRAATPTAVWHRPPTRLRRSAPAARLILCSSPIVLRPLRRLIASSPPTPALSQSLGGAASLASSRDLAAAYLAASGRHVGRKRRTKQPWHSPCLSRLLHGWLLVDGAILPSSRPPCAHRRRARHRRQFRGARIQTQMHGPHCLGSPILPQEVIAGIDYQRLRDYLYRLGLLSSIRPLRPVRKRRRA